MAFADLDGAMELDMELARGRPKKGEANWRTPRDVGWMPNVDYEFIPEDLINRFERIGDALTYSRKRRWDLARQAIVGVP